MAGQLLLKLGRLRFLFKVSNVCVLSGWLPTETYWSRSGRDEDGKCMEFFGSDALLADAGARAWIRRGQMRFW